MTKKFTLYRQVWLIVLGCILLPFGLKAQYLKTQVVTGQHLTSLGKDDQGNLLYTDYDPVSNLYFAVKLDPANSSSVSSTPAITFDPGGAPFGIVYNGGKAYISSIAQAFFEFDPSSGSINPVNYNVIQDFVSTLAMTPEGDMVGVGLDAIGGGTEFVLVKYPLPITSSTTGTLLNIDNAIPVIANDYSVPYDMEVNANGDIFIVGLVTGKQVLKYTRVAPNIYSKSIYLSGNYYSALALDDDGDIFVTESTDGTNFDIKKYDGSLTAATTPLESLGANLHGELDLVNNYYEQPHGMVIVNGIIYVNDGPNASDEYIMYRFAPDLNITNWGTLAATVGSNTDVVLEVTFDKNISGLSAANFEITKNDVYRTTVTSIEELSPSQYKIHINSGYGNYKSTPSAITGNFSVKFVNGGGITVSNLASLADRTVNVTNASPVLGAATSAPSFTEDGAAVNITSMVNLSDDAGFAGTITAKITTNYETGDDVLSFVNDNATLYGSLSSSFNPSNGELTITPADSSVTLAQVAAAIENIKYSHSVTEPAYTWKSITVSYTDWFGAESVFVAGINIDIVNDPPVLTAPTLAIDMNQGDTYDFSATHPFNITDPDLGTGNIQLSLTATNGKLRFGTTGAFNTTLSETGLLSTVLSQLNALQFQPDPSYYGTDAKISIEVSDLGNTGSGGAQTVSGIVSFNISSEVASVQNISVLPASPDLFGTGDAVNITLTFDKAVSVNTAGGTPSITTNILPERAFTYSGGSGSTVLTFSYTIQEGDSTLALDAKATNALNLNGGAITNLAQTVEANLTLPTIGGGNTVYPARSVNIDGIRPHFVEAAIPAPGTYKVGDQLDITLFTNEVLNNSAATSQLELNVGGQTKYATLNSETNSVTNHNTALVYRYTVQANDLDLDGIAIVGIDIPSVVDAAGNGFLAASYSVIPSTGGILVDGLGPKVISVVYPADSTYKIGDVLTFEMKFDEEINNAATASYDFMIGGVSKTANATVTGDSSMLFSYTVAEGDLDTDGITLGTSLELTSDIEDLYGNALSSFALPTPQPVTANVLVDGVRPSLASFTRLSPSVTNTDSVVYRIEFSEAVNGLTADKFSVKFQTVPLASAVSNILTPDNKVYTFKVKGYAPVGTLTIEIPGASAAQIKDIAGNSMLNTLITGPSYDIDQQDPVISSVSVPASKTYLKDEVLTIALNYDEDINITGTPRLAIQLASGTVFAELASVVSNVATFQYTVLEDDEDLDGITINSLNLNGAVIIDAIGNTQSDFVLHNLPVTTGVLVDAKQPELLSITRTDASPTNNNVLHYKLTFSELVTNLDNAIKVLISGYATPVPFTVTQDVIVNPEYTVTFMIDPSSGMPATGNVAMSLDSVLVADIAGNKLDNNIDDIEEYIYDIQQPTVTTISASKDTVILGDVLDVKATFSEPVTATAGATLDLIIGGVTRTATIEAASNTTELHFKYTVADDDMAIGVTVQNLQLNTATIKDSLGNDADLAFTAVNLGNTVDGIIPSITSINRLDPAESNLSQVSYEVVFSEAVVNVSADDFSATTSGSLTAPTLSVTAIDGKTYHVVLSGLSGKGEVFISENLSRDIEDLHGNPIGTAGPSSVSYKIDNEKSIPVLSGTNRVNALTTVTITFDKAVTGLTISEFNITNATASNLATPDNIHYTIELSPTAEGSILIQLPADKTSDALGNGNLASNQLEITYDISAPVITTSEFSIEEKSPVNTVVGTVAATELDPANLQDWAITQNADQNANSIPDYLINPTTGVITINDAALDYDIQSQSDIKVTVSDGLQTSAEATITIKLISLNTAPSGIILSNSAIDENSALNTVIGVFSTVDIDPGDTHTYSLVSGTGDDDNASFNISGNQLLLAAAVDFETKSSYSIRVRTTDSEGLLFEQVFTINISDVNEAPTTVYLDNTKVDENVALGTTIGILSTADVDAGSTFTYSLPAGILDNDYFSINGNQLNVNTALDFETKSSYQIRVRVTDNGNLTKDETFTIQVNDLNEVPLNLNLGSNSISENAALGSLIGLLTATDPDAGDILTYTLPSGSLDNQYFALNSNQLVLNTSLDFEQQASYQVKVRVADQAGLFVEQVFTINVLDVNEAPDALTLSNNQVNENAATGTIIGTLSADDPDNAETLAYTLPANQLDNQYFIIDGNQLKLNTDLDYEQKRTYQIVVRVTDQAGLFDEKTFNIQVMDLNESPGNLMLSNLQIDENESIGTLIGELSAHDPDDSDVLTYSLPAGELDNQYFLVNGTQLTLNTSIDFEQQSSYQVKVRVTDQAGLFTENTFIITVNDVNEVPGSLTLSNHDVNENAATGTNIGTLTAADPDINDVLTFSLPPGELDNQYFLINGNQLQLNTALDLEQRASYQVKVRVTDQAGLYSEQTFTINVLDINEAPVSLELSAAEVLETAVANTLIGNLSAVDPDANESFTFSLPAGEMDNQYFLVNGTQLLLNTSLNYELKSSYQVKIRVTDHGGLYYESMFTIQVLDVNEPPTVDPISDQKLCSDIMAHTIQVTGVTPGPESGQTISPSITADQDMFDVLVAKYNSNSATITITYKLKPNAVGTAFVTLKVKDDGGSNNGGLDEVSTTFMLTAIAVPTPTISSDKGWEISKGDIARLTASGGVTYVWDMADGIMGGMNSAILSVRPMQPATYRVTVTNADGCSSSASVDVTVKEDFNIEGTNILTPNGDGRNDRWIIKNIDAYPGNEVKIFDRAGRMIYYKKGYMNEWDGTVNGKRLGEGTYYYIIDFGPGLKKVKGFITIILDKY
ncbi:hypothetical protein COR50_15005 [Chitinophaga caeni]|uniref:Cadherin domain-containing protein n=1 Tax=Chitinophaga caeni TaxID=2029983 RepID=A0A291QWY3_9BACT|nr:cadherin domain-containing protein [Chitinophaga caeni]ATL48364.1 hypothetical protein COR50_15005 [Chitinophaga caeni]